MASIWYYERHFVVADIDEINGSSLDKQNISLNLPSLATAEEPKQSYLPTQTLLKTQPTLLF